MKLISKKNLPVRSLRYLLSIFGCSGRNPWCWGIMWSNLFWLLVAKISGIEKRPSWLSMTAITTRTANTKTTWTNWVSLNGSAISPLEFISPKNLCLVIGISVSMYEIEPGIFLDFGGLGFWGDEKRLSWMTSEDELTKKFDLSSKKLKMSQSTYLDNGTVHTFFPIFSTVLVVVCIWYYQEFQMAIMYECRHIQKL